MNSESARPKLPSGVRGARSAQAGASCLDPLEVSGKRSQATVMSPHPFPLPLLQLKGVSTCCRTTVRDGREPSLLVFPTHLPL